MSDHYPPPAPGVDTYTATCTCGITYRIVCGVPVISCPTCGDILRDTTPPGRTNGHTRKANP